MLDRARVVAIALVLAAPALARAGDLDALAEAVKEAQFPHEKRAAAKKLADLRTPESRARLLAVWADANDTWTRQAAELELLLLEDAEVDAAIAEKLDEDVPFDEELAAVFKARKKPFPAARLVARLEAAAAEDRLRLVEALGSVGGAEARAALRGLVAGKAGDVRAKAFGELARESAGELRPLALELLDDGDRGVAGVAVAVVVGTGTAADLPRLAEVLAKRTDEADTPIALVAYRGVAKWGDAKLKLATCLAGLRDPDERRAQGALAAFADASGAEVDEELCRLVRRGRAQETRLASAERLALSTAPADLVVPYLIAALRETYEPPQEEEVGLVEGLFKGFVRIATFGVVDVLESLARHRTREAFDASLAKVVESLEKRTGASPGKTHEAWLEWAIDRGYTVVGDNVVARLFSGEPARRKRAHESGARLLGFASRDDFVKKNPGLAKESDVGLELAKRLVAKGLPADERH